MSIQVENEDLFISGEEAARQRAEVSLNSFSFALGCLHGTLSRVLEDPELVESLERRQVRRSDLEMLQTLLSRVEAVFYRRDEKKEGGR